MTDTLASREGAMRCLLQTEFTGRRSMKHRWQLSILPPCSYVLESGSRSSSLKIPTLNNIYCFYDLSLSLARALSLSFFFLNVVHLKLI